MSVKCNSLAIPLNKKVKSVKGIVKQMFTEENVNWKCPSDCFENGVRWNNGIPFAATSMPKIREYTKRTVSFDVDRYKKTC